MKAHHPENPVPDLNMLEYGAQAEADAHSCLCIVGMSGRQRDACARALGLDAEAATAFLLGLRARNATSDVMGDGQPTAANLLPRPDAVTDARETWPPEMPSMARAVDEAACLPTLLAQHPRLRILGFYLSPWEAFLEACEESGMQSAWEIKTWMHAWSQVHQQLLAARQAAPERVFLINAGRMDQPEDLKLALRGKGVAWPDRSPAGESIPRLPINGALSHLLASSMAETGREYWELYESLESCAVLFDREPEFQATVDLVDTADLTSLLVSFCQAQTLAAEADRALSSNAVSGHDRGAATTDTLQMLDEVQRENELLSLQLHQLHEELHYHVAYNAGLRDILNQAGVTAETARRLISELTSAKTDAAPR